MKHPASGGMNVKDDYTWRSNGHNRTNNPLLPGNVRVLIIGKSNGGKTTLLLNLLLQPEWLDYNQLYVFGRSLHQQEYQILKKGFENGLSKKQVENIFLHQNVLSTANLSPLQAIDEFNGIRDDFYNECTMVQQI